MKLPITRMKRHLNTSTKVAEGTLISGSVENRKRFKKNLTFLLIFLSREVEVEIF